MVFKIKHPEIKNNDISVKINKIYSFQKSIDGFESALALLMWDMETYMPKKGIESRSNSLSIIQEEIHNRFCDKKIFKLINDILENKTISAKDRFVIERLKKDIDKQKKIPSKLVSDMAAVAPLCVNDWKLARQKHDFSIVRNNLSKTIDLKREQIKYVNCLGVPYNSLLDNYEEGITSEKIDKEFSYLKERLVPLLKKILFSKKYIKQQENQKIVKINKEILKKACEFVKQKMYLTDDICRLDSSTHPFTVRVGKDDARITTRYEENIPLHSIYATLHEGGHALYELGLPKEYDYTVVGKFCSFALHESQSRFFENMIGKNKLFSRIIFEHFKKEVSEYKNVLFEDWFFDLNKVELQPIRVNSDELTYCFHIILRYELEKKIADGSLRVDDIPKEWGKLSKELFGYIPKNDLEGCLQDVHWMQGDIGYFPTYLIGSVYSAQLYDTISKNKKIISDIEKGELKSVIDWLKDNVHKYGRLYSADEIIKRACGTGLNAKLFADYIEKKYTELYNL
ncbi:MAG: carboxypeptidase M32 [Candidatus Woesearchaeota archaeon]|jgi:carboxypeptidase Taq